MALVKRVVPSLQAPAKDSPDIPVVVFRDGLPAFPLHRRFALVQWGGPESPFCRLQSLDDPDLSFVVVEPSIFFPHYEPEIDDHTVERLELHSAEDAIVLVVLTIGSNPEETTANLLGPIVVNRHTLEAAQVVLSDGSHTTQERLFSASA
jgi:flagellar assembly factor FliW